MSALATALLLSLAQDPAKTDETPVEVYLKDGLRFRTKDGSFQGRIGGRFIGHYRAVFDRPDDGTAPLRSVPDAAFIRQIRFETEGLFRQEWGYKVQVDFPSGQYNQPAGTGPSGVSGTLRDGYVEWRRHPELMLRLGQFFESISAEDASSTRFIDFAERSIMNRLLPGRELGLEARGTLFDGVLGYFAMLSNGNALLVDQGRAVTDSNDEKELSALVHVKPFAADGPDGLKGLRLSLGASITDQDDVPSQNFDLISTELSIQYLDSIAGGPALDGRRWRVVPQMAWPIGPFAVRAELLLRKDDLADGAAESAIESRGFYGSVSCILTGEVKVLEDRIVPLGGWGAVEVLARYARLKADGVFDAGLALQAGNSDEATSVTVGANWWAARNVRFTLNVIRESYEDKLEFDGRTEDAFWGLLARAQIDF
jgi:phosphate-selective porin OprO and OprP